MKYWRTFLLGLQSEFQYRSNLIGWLIIGLIPAVTLTLVWFSLMGDKETLGGFTKGDFIVYYFFMTVGWYLVGGVFSQNLGNGIKEGRVNVTLVKPYNIVLGQALEEQAWKVTSLIFVIPCTAILLYLFRAYIDFNLTFMDSLFLIISIILGGLIFALFEALMGIAAFWITELWPLIGIREFLLSLFGAQLIPFILMPAPIQFVSNILPFKYIFYTPLSILLHKTSTPLFDIFIQIFFIGLLFILYKFIWNAGIRRYEAVGG